MVVALQAQEVLDDALFLVGCRHARERDAEGHEHTLGRVDGACEPFHSVRMDGTLLRGANDDVLAQPVEQHQLDQRVDLVQDVAALRDVRNLCDKIVEALERRHQLLASRLDLCWLGPRLSLRGGARLQRRSDVETLPVTEAGGELPRLVEVATDEHLEERGALLTLILEQRDKLRARHQFLIDEAPDDSHPRSVVRHLAHRRHNPLRRALELLRVLRRQGSARVNGMGVRRLTSELVAPLPPRRRVGCGALEHLADTDRVVVRLPLLESA